MTHIEVMKKALEALEGIHPGNMTPMAEEAWNKAITALHLAIEQAEKQEPVAWMTIDAYGEEDDIHYENPEGHLPDGWTYLPLYTHPLKAKQPQEEPLGYWNAVQGWVELPEEANKPTAWVYPEALEAFQQGKPWTAYGADGSGPNSDGIERIPLYTTPPAAPVQKSWNWFDAPVKTAWGHKMVVADLAIDKYHTVSVYCERDQTAKVEAMFAPPAAQRQPLTEDDLKKLWYSTKNIMGWYSFQEIVRIIEAAHGIGEKK